MDQYSDEQEAFIAKVDAFAESLTAAEQAALLHLLGEDVAGFTDDRRWPGLVNVVGPIPISGGRLIGKDDAGDVKGWLIGKDDAGDFTG